MSSKKFTISYRIKSGKNKYLSLFYDNEWYRRMYVQVGMNIGKMKDNKFVICTLNPGK